MYNLKVDKQKNRLLIIIKDRLNEVELRKYNKEIIKLIDDLDYGFTVIADLRYADKSVIKDYHSFKTVREYGTEKGLKDSVVILDEEKNNIIQNELCIKNRNIVKSMNEAELFLKERHLD